MFKASKAAVATVGAAALVLGVSVAGYAASTITMTLSTDAAVGTEMTIQFNEGVTPGGTYFDIWACPNQDVQPVDGADEGDCEPMTFFNRETVDGLEASAVLAMKWVLGNEPTPSSALDGTPYLNGGVPYLINPPGWDGDAGAPEAGSNGWCDYQGWYIIVNDFDSGEFHSNWSNAISASGCGPAAAAATTATQGIGLNLDAEPGQQVAGAPVEFHGYKMAPSSNYTLVLEPGAQTLAAGTANASGNFVGPYTLPSLAPGTYRLILTATGPDGRTYQLVQEFVVGADGAFLSIGAAVGSIGVAAPSYTG
jgi:hypothetical protein